MTMRQDTGNGGKRGFVSITFMASAIVLDSGPIKRQDCTRTGVC